MILIILIKLIKTLKDNINNSEKKSYYKKKQHYSLLNSAKLLRVISAGERSMFKIFIIKLYNL